MRTQASMYCMCHSGLFILIHSSMQCHSVVYTVLLKHVYVCCLTQPGIHCLNWARFYCPTRASIYLLVVLPMWDRGTKN